MSAADAAYGGIIDLVLNSELRPGERTSVNLLAARLNLGRTPVKEAITRLQTEGLLSVAGRSGTMVNRIDRLQTEQLFALRRALEDFAADFAVENLSARDLQQIKKCLRRLGRSNFTSEFVRANVAFHSMIVAAAGSPFVAGGHPQVAAVGDINGDGIPDILAANRLDGAVRVLLGNGSHGFTPAIGFPACGSCPRHG